MDLLCASYDERTYFHHDETTYCTLFMMRGPIVCQLYEMTYCKPVMFGKSYCVPVMMGGVIVRQL